MNEAAVVTSIRVYGSWSSSGHNFKKCLEFENLNRKLSFQPTAFD